jgi:hypothetical protein
VEEFEGAWVNAPDCRPRPPRVAGRAGGLLFDAAAGEVVASPSSRPPSRRARSGRALARSESLLRCYISAGVVIAAEEPFQASDLVDTSRRRHPRRAHGLYDLGQDMERL